MQRSLIILFVITIILVIGFFVLNQYIYNQKQAPNPPVDYNTSNPGS